MKEKMVTRTVIESVILAVIADLKDNTIRQETYTAPDLSKLSDKKVIEYIQEKKITDTTVKVVTIVKREQKETLYGMKESTFMEHAKVLPDRFANIDKLDG